MLNRQLRNMRLWSVTMVLLFAGSTTYADSVPPDSAEANPANPFMKLAIRGPLKAPVTLWPTHNGHRITNADGSQVQSGGMIAPTATFTVPGIMNGLTVTDHELRIGNPGDPRDPGTISYAVFSDGIMSELSLSNWLLTNGYVEPAAIFMPGFFPVGFSEVYYGVNLAELGSAGQDFVSSHAPGDSFTVDATGTVEALPMYTFSSTPLIYVPGIGWWGTPLDEGTSVQYVAFHTLSAASDP